MPGLAGTIIHSFIACCRRRCVRRAGSFIYLYLACKRLGEPGERALALAKADVNIPGCCLLVYKYDAMASSDGMWTLEKLIGYSFKPAEASLIVKYVLSGKVA